MNTIAVTLLAGSIAALPVASVTDLKPANPFEGLSVSAAGIGIELGPDGFEATPAGHGNFEIELRLKSGTPIRVRL